jgi:hypothetical protein
MTPGTTETVIPAQAGIHRSNAWAMEQWIPAFAGMTALAYR